MRRPARILLALILGGILFSAWGCAAHESAGEVPEETSQSDLASSPFQQSMDLSYAEEFSVQYWEDGCALITIEDEGQYLVVPPAAEPPEGLGEEIAVIRRPVDSIYLAATSAMDFFVRLDALDQIGLSGTQASGWQIEEARQAMEQGEILYGGKYSAPDYERIYSKGCGLAIESTMIHHAPEVKEQLESLGIPVLVERSSYEKNPLGRMEWIKLYGVLTGTEELADRLYQQQLEQLEGVLSQENTGKTVAFFYITSDGTASVRTSSDYITRMIQMAGADTVFTDLGADKTEASSVNLQMEVFYSQAKDADYIIYNSTIDGELENLAQLLEKSPLLADFKAVKEGNVWCTRQKLFQSSMGLGEAVLDIHTLLTQEDPSPDQLTYVYPLK